MAASVGDWAMYIVVGGTLGFMFFGTLWIALRTLIRLLRDLFGSDN